MKVYVTQAFILSRDVGGREYFTIKYKEISGKWYEGFGSYDLEIVKRWYKNYLIFVNDMVVRNVNDVNTLIKETN